jgi:hypothetical protein
MKTVIATIALSLVSAASFANGVPSYVDGSAYEQAHNMFKSQRTRAEVIAELKAAPRLPGYIDGSAYEQAHNMFKSQRTRAEVIAELKATPRLPG